MSSIHEAVTANCVGDDEVKKEEAVAFETQMTVLLKNERTNIESLMKMRMENSKTLSTIQQWIQQARVLEVDMLVDSMQSLERSFQKNVNNQPPPTSVPTPSLTSPNCTTQILQNQESPFIETAIKMVDDAIQNNAESIEEMKTFFRSAIESMYEQRKNLERQQRQAQHNNQDQQQKKFAKGLWE